MPSPGNARKPQIWPVSLSKMTPKGGNSTDHGQNLISSKGGQDASACKISGHSFHAFSRKCLETYPDRWTDWGTDRQRGQKTVMVGRMDQRTHVHVERGYFGLRTDGQTDGQPENIMPLVPKGEGIKDMFFYYYFSTLRLHSSWKSFLVEDNDLFILCSQYHGC